jgi:hypothetical protein
MPKGLRNLTGRIAPARGRGPKSPPRSTATLGWCCRPHRSTSQPERPRSRRLHTTPASLKGSLSTILHDLRSTELSKNLSMPPAGATTRDRGVTPADNIRSNQMLPPTSRSGCPSPSLPAGPRRPVFTGDKGNHSTASAEVKSPRELFFRIPRRSEGAPLDGVVRVALGCPAIPIKI